MTWCYADCWESVAKAQPGAAAFIQGERVVDWAAFERQADALAFDLLNSGLNRQSKVAVYQYNGPEFITDCYAAFKAGLAPFNVNYRYGPEELFYLFDNADAEAVVFHAEFGPIRQRLPWDWATVNADGTLNLLGRGSQCINTGGEKVFPEEVEEALKRRPAVRDAAVAGLPDARFGERLCALMELKPGAADPGAAALSAHGKSQLADYKAQRDLVIVETVGRAPNGKLDYKVVKAVAQAWAAAGLDNEAGKTA